MISIMTSPLFSSLLVWPAMLLMFFATFIFTATSTDGYVYRNEDKTPDPPLSQSSDRHFSKLQKLKASLLVKRDSVISTAPSPSPSPAPAITRPIPQGGSRVYHVTSYGGDPTGKVDSTEAIVRALSDACKSTGEEEGWLMEGIRNLGGVQFNLDGGDYIISRPLRLPSAGLGNLMIHGGTLRASDDFPSNGYLIELSSAPASSSTSANAEPNNFNNHIQIKNTSEFVKLAASSSYNYEYITFRDLQLDSNFRGGGISILNSLRITIDNCYFTHFTTNGILVQSGHETLIRNSFIGQHITAGGDPGERNFSGTGISLLGNDNVVTDVVIFSAAVGIMVTGQANILTGVHCYNKATGFGGTGIYLKLAGLTQTRIVNSYLDFTGIVAEDPVQLHISNTFFLGDAYITLKSIKGVVNGINIVDNMFSGSNRGISIVQLDQSNGPFKQINQAVIHRNNVNGMQMKSTVGRAEIQGNGTSWILDFNPILLFPDLIKNVQYSFRTTGNGGGGGGGGAFPNHVIRNVSENKVVIESNVAVSASIFAMVDQGLT